MEKCVGAFRLYPCDNLTERILCAKCYAKVERVMSSMAPSHPARPTRLSPRRRSGMEVQHGTR